jgi:hypothetical protein
VTQFERDMEAFRHHVRELRALGWSHVHVKYGNKEYFVEQGSTQPAEHVGEQLPIGFRGSEEEEDE